MQQIDVPALDGIEILKVARNLYREHLFGIDASQNLIAINVDLISRGVTPYRILDIAKHYGRNSNMAIDHENIWILHKSATAVKIQSFDGELRLEDYGVQENYLVWKQWNHFFAAVDIYNIVTFWNTLTGKLIHKKLLPATGQITNAQEYRAHDYQGRYQDRANQFDGNS